MGFKEMKMMKSTEPSVDEVGKGMKKGGMPKMATKKIQKFGTGGLPAGSPEKGGGYSSMPATTTQGNPRLPLGRPITGTGPMGPPQGGGGVGAVRPRQPGVTPKPFTPQPQAVRPRQPGVTPKPFIPQPGATIGTAVMPRGPKVFGGMGSINSSGVDKLNQALLGRKKGGEVESKKMHAKEERQIKGIKKELMSHEGKPASKAHKGLATGGVANAQGGYKKGGVAKYATGGLIQKYATGGVVNGAAGYKEGGHAVMSCKDGGGFKAMKKGNC